MWSARLGRDCGTCGTVSIAPKACCVAACACCARDIYVKAQSYVRRFRGQLRKKLKLVKGSPTDYQLANAFVIMMQPDVTSPASGDNRSQAFYEPCEGPLSFHAHCAASDLSTRAPGFSVEASHGDHHGWDMSCATDARKQPTD